MVGVQYTPEQRNFLAMAFERYRSGRDSMPQIVEEFQQKFPGVAAPHRNTIRNVHKKQMSYFTTHNLNSKASLAL